MSNINSVGNQSNQRITVNQDGLFELKGHAVDMISLVFQIQGRTKDFAQKRLALTARQLWDTNEQSKQLIFLLNRVRSARPTGDATASVGKAQIEKIATDFYNTYGIDPLAEYDLTSLTHVIVPDPSSSSAEDKPQFVDLKQAQIDQLIEGIKSQISKVSSRQELLNNDTQKYTRFGDETKEAMAAIEKAVANSYTNQESKI